MEKKYYCDCGSLQVINTICSECGKDYEANEICRRCIDISNLSEKYRRLENKLDMTIWDMARFWLTGIDIKDGYTSDHSMKVEQWAYKIGKLIDYPDMKLLQIAATMHDIGKLFVSDEVLKKKGSLTEAEYAEMKTHADKGADYVQNYASLSLLAPIVRHHHERWDGTGYPKGWSGEIIPVASRIICIADAIDAMQRARIYRDKKSDAEVKAELIECAGTQFDPHMIEAMLKSRMI